MKAQKYLVTTSIQGRSRTRLWDASRPMPLDFPFHWVIESTEHGVRVRRLGPGNEGTSGKLASVHRLSTQETKDGSTIELDREKAVVCQIRSIPELDPQIWRLHSQAKQNEVTGARNPRSVFIYTTIRGFVLSAEAVQASFAARTASGKVFKVRKTADGLILRSYIAGVTLFTPDGEEKLGIGDSRQFKRSEMENISVGYKRYQWHFANTLLASALPITKEDDKEIAWFWKSLLGAALSGIVLMGISSLFAPTEEEKKKEELIPPQFAKIILRTRAEKSSQLAKYRARGQQSDQAEQLSGAGDQAPLAQRDQSKPETQATRPSPDKTQTHGASLTAKANSAEAARAKGDARAKALKNLMHGIMLAGVSKVTDQKNILAQAGSSGTSTAHFDSPAAGGDRLNVGNLGAAMSEVRGGSAVGVLGGRGAGDGKGAPGSVGYGNGVHASLGRGAGGTSDVSLDPGGAVTEEGLTNEEVYAVIYKHMSEVRYCYESAMLSSPKLEGRLVAGFMIGPDGKVRTARPASSNTGERKLDDCVIRRLMTWQFPHPKGGVNVNVSYPFVFKTLGGA